MSWRAGEKETLDMCSVHLHCYVSEQSNRITKGRDRASHRRRGAGVGGCERVSTRQTETESKEKCQSVAPGND